MNTQERVDLLFLAWNRLAFTKESFPILLANTDWGWVRQLYIHDDGSSDGTAEWLQEQLDDLPVAASFVATSFRSPVAVMNHFIEIAQAPILAKIDNDVLMPPGWLPMGLDVLDRNPKVAMLGLEALYSHLDDPGLRRSYAPARFISGLGLYRRQAFALGLPTPEGQWFGFETWQMTQGRKLQRGWIKPALPIFLLDRLPFEPWLSLTRDYVRRGWQRSWPAYKPSNTLWHWRWPPKEKPPREKAAVALPTRRPKFLCALRVKNEAAFIHEVLTRALEFCECAYIFDDHSTDDTVAICRSFRDKVTVFPSPFEGLDEARDKNYLLEHIIEADPEWVLWIDGDEVLEKRGPKRIRAAAGRAGNITIYSLRIAYLWNDPHHVRVDGIYGRFYRPSLFKMRGQPSNNLHFAATGVGGNFHCGNIPTGLIGRSATLNIRLKHYGYMSPEKRRSKYEWYVTKDPDNAAEDHYRHIVGIPGARFAPGPPRLIQWTE